MTSFENSHTEVCVTMWKILVQVLSTYLLEFLMDSFWIYKIQYHDSFTRAPAEALLFFQNLADIRSEQGW